LDGGRLAFALYISSSSGSNASLEGTGVKVEPDAAPTGFGRLLDGAGVEVAVAARELGAAGELDAGVF
jgi:hypothetical protein